MSLIISVSGNRATVKADSFDFSVSMSGSRAIISTPDRQATVGFVDPRASVKWSGAEPTVCSSHICHNMFLWPIYDPMILPTYARPWTLGNNTTLDEYYRTDLITWSHFYADIGVYGAYLYYVTDEGQVVRILIDGLDTAPDQSMYCDPSYQYVAQPCLSVVSEDVVYVLYHYNDGADDELRLAKCDFGAATRTEMDRWNAQDTYQSDTKHYWETAWMIRAKAAGKDYLIAATYWLGDSKPNVLRLLVWDWINATEVGFAFHYFMDSDDYWDWFSSPSFVTTPAVYGSKVAFTAIPDAYDDTSTVLPWPTIIFDLSDDSTHVVSGYRSGSLAVPNVQGSGVDHTSGIYYVYVSNWDEDSTPHHIVEIDLTDSSPAYATTQARSIEGRIGKGNKAYALDDGGSDYDIRGPLPNLTAIKTTDNQMPVFIDDANNVGWQLDSGYNVLNGYELSGGTNKSITLDWASSIFEYTNNQTIRPIMAFDGLFVAVIYSRRTTPTVAYQNELVIFGPEVT